MILSLVDGFSLNDGCYKNKALLNGDFMWTTEVNDKKILVVADGTDLNKIDFN